MCILHCLVLLNGVLLKPCLFRLTSFKFPLACIVELIIFRSSQCSTTGVTKAVVCVILSVGWCI